MSELLITLLIIAQIATFSIPKVITAQQNSFKKSAAKEMAGMLSSAYAVLKYKSPPTSATKAADLIPYLNYVSSQTTGLIDNQHNTGAWDCSWSACYRMHNGGMLSPLNASFAGTATTNAVWFIYDPDGVDSGLNTGYGKGIDFAIYFNGMVRTGATIFPDTVSSNGTKQPDSNLDPPWFSWN
ncbi:MAG TPA: hypothetical protein V6C52_06115 [Coleofasciculaceae cyanobacterium]